MGFDMLVINRIPISDKVTLPINSLLLHMQGHLKRDHQLEFLWQGSKTLKQKAQLLTHVLWNHYSAPQGKYVYISS